jgi:quinol-cytochrome oxidoreductase complex cytochrome b subunit
MRVLFTGAYNKPRRFNSLLGLALLVIVLLLDFTGYVLRWDEGIRWALIAGTNLLASIPVIGNALVLFISGGMEPGPVILIRYYAWHIFGLTIAGGFILVWHLFRVRRDGGVAAPPPRLRVESSEAAPVRISRRELLRREVIVMLVAGGALILLSTFLAAPIAQPIDINAVSITEPHAPWFFLWVQELLQLGDPFLFGVAIPLGVLVLLLLIPYIFPGIQDTELGRWFPRSGRSAQLFTAILVVAILTLTILSITTTIQP